MLYACFIHSFSLLLHFVGLSGIIFYIYDVFRLCWCRQSGPAIKERSIKMLGSPVSVKNSRYFVVWNSTPHFIHLGTIKATEQVWAVMFIVRRCAVVLPLNRRNWREFLLYYSSVLIILAVQKLFVLSGVAQYRIMPI